ncbi:hypothetical protein N0824_03828 [Microcystis sp. 0824]|nr:hypothetical protein N0824_03828 [Microcystis sp. 0824]
MQKVKGSFVLPTPHTPHQQTFSADPMYEDLSNHLRLI